MLIQFSLKLGAVLILPLLPALLIVRWIESWRFQIYLARQWPDANAWAKVRPWGWGLAMGVYLLGAVYLAVRLF